MPSVSIICPTLNEEKFISNCVQSIISQDFQKERLEVLFIDGMSCDSTRKILNNYIRDYSYLRLIDNPNKTVPFALNLGIKASKGEIIIRIDAHCNYPSNYVSTLVTNLSTLNADNVGGVWNTISANNNSICNSIAITTSHQFGIGDAVYRLGAKEIQQVDTVPFGCYRRETFEKIGLFDEELIRNQDDEFNARLIKNGGKIYLIPDLIIDYTARDSIKKMAKMFYQYGLFKPLVNKKLGKAATVRQFFPALFLLGLISGSIISILSVSIILTFAFIGIISIYFLIGLLIGITNAFKRRDFNLIFLVPYDFLVIHLSYGWGYLDGIFRVVFNRKFIVQSNR